MAATPPATATTRAGGSITMHDALLNRSLRYTILALISGLAGGSVVLCYRGLFELIAGDYPVAGMRLGWGLAAGVAALLLIRYRGDLIDD